LAQNQTAHPSACDILALFDYAKATLLLLKESADTTTLYKGHEP
jgi:hypothetical protein